MYKKMKSHFLTC